MNIVEAFVNLDNTSLDLMRIYWDISDNYRGPCDFAVGLFQFIETDEGKKLENKLSALTDQVNSIIDEIIGRLNEEEIIQEENRDKINSLIKSFTLSFISIHGKNVWFSEHDMGLNERAKLNGYYEKFDNKVRLLNKLLTGKYGIQNINDGMEIIRKDRENDPDFEILKLK